jgi:uncharacterized membrane protein YkoI
MSMKKLSVFFLIAVFAGFAAATSYAYVSEGAISLERAIAAATEEAPGLATTAQWQRGYYEIRVGAFGEKYEKVYLDPRDGRIMGLMSPEFNVDSNANRGRIKLEFKRGIFKVTVLQESGKAKDVYVDAVNGKILKVEEHGLS